MQDVTSSFLNAWCTQCGISPPHSTHGISTFATLQQDYDHLCNRTTLVVRANRATLAITGNDRLPWLHNLTTQQIKNVESGHGVYTFALQLQGRILFDMNVLVLADRLLIDIDRQFLPKAIAHFTKFTIVEDVTVQDVSDQWLRLALAGPHTVDIMTKWGASHIAAMATLSHATLSLQGSDILFARHDFSGPLGAELFIPAPSATAAQKELFALHNQSLLHPVGDEAVRVRTLEAGIPQPGFEITEEYLPAETRQLERAVSYTKGCYLGQEVVERMRSRGVVARQLVGLTLTETSASHGTPLLDADGKQIGQITSHAHSLATNQSIALGYVKTAHAQPGTQLRTSSEQQALTATVVPLPFIPSQRTGS